MERDTRRFTYRDTLLLYALYISAPDITVLSILCLHYIIYIINSSPRLYILNMKWNEC